MKTVAIIPFKDEPERTIRVAEWVIEEGVELYLYDNGSTPESLGEVLEAVGDNSLVSALCCPGFSIYQMWNHGWRRARNAAKGEPVNVAFLNNDIWYCVDTLAILAERLRERENAWIVYPNYNKDIAEGIDPGQAREMRQTHGTYAQGGMGGSMFMIRGELLDDPLPPIDEQFEWWCGDDDLVRQVALHGGKQYRIIGLPLYHENEATASNGQNDWTHQAKGRDMERLNKKYA